MTVLLTGAASVKVLTLAAAGHALFVEQPRVAAAAIVDCCTG